APHRPAAGAIPAEPDENVVAVFSSAVRKGRWRANRRVHAYAVFGSVEIDLSEAVFEYQQVVIKAFSVFGSVDVRVPENVSVRGAGGSVLGSFEVHTHDSDEAEAPVIYVDGWSVLGSVDVRPKRGKIVADILDRVHRRVEKGLRKHL
ncbi:cell wall-active antibiotics response protein, partial [Streptomyces sp. ICN988]